MPAARAIATVLLLAVLGSSSHAGGAAGGAVVSAHVPSATSLAATCASGGSATSFGTVLPGASSVTPADCVLTFGSSNDTASLLVHQVDGSTSAMGGSANGLLDAAFAGGTATFATSVSSTTVPFGAADVQADGMLLIATPLGQGAGTPFDVRRVRQDGTLDPSFGTGGVASISMGAGGTGAYATAVQPDGKVLVCGFSDDGTGNGNEIAVARLLADGSALDPSFGNAGRVFVSGTTGTDLCYDMEVGADGRILLAGSVQDLANSNFDTALVRLTADGRLDPTYGQGGLSRIPLGPAGSHDFAYGLAVDGLGRAVIFGSVADGTWTGAGRTWGDVLVARIRSDGALDTTFATGGSARLSVNPLEFGVGLALQRDGRILVSGRTLGATWDGVTWRLLADGSNDPSFNANAPLLLDNGGVDWAGPATEDSHGRIVQSMSWTDGGIERLRVLRMDANGTPDPTFGPGGARTVLVGDSENKVRWFREVDGKLVMVGYGIVGGRRQPIAARYDAPRVPDHGPGSDWSTGADGAFGVCTRSVTGVSGSWQVDPLAGCSAANGTHWRAVPASAAVPAARAATTATTATGTVRLRFGLRVGASQPAGAYAAPLRFAVVAPTL